MSDAMQGLRDEYAECCRALGVERELQTRPHHSAEPHVEIVDGAYHYVVCERGNELERRVATSRDEVLYWLVSAIVFSLSSAYSARHRVPGRSFRRALFERQIELMEQLDSRWADRKREEIRETLERVPYDDAVEG
jgi:hypothetical protein